MATPSLTDYSLNWPGAQQISYPASFYNQIVEEQREYNKLQMEREDTAYQRMVADMKAAGLNPWTGISTGGSSSSSLTPPSKSGLDSLLNILDYNSTALHRANSELKDAISSGCEILKVILPFVAMAL